MNLKKSLMEARTLIADIEDWAQGSHARDADGTEVEPWSPRAICWCASGALAKACGLRSWDRHTISYDEGVKAMAKSSKELYGIPFIYVNDGGANYRLLPYSASDQDRSEVAHTATLRVFDHAIANAIDT